jgi:hypothetical protein
MSKEAQYMGRAAEQRVVEVAWSMGMTARLATEEENGAGKIDVFIEEIPVQVSCKGKSAQEQRRLEKRGIVTVVAGEEIGDEELVKLLSLLSSPK